MFSHKPPALDAPYYQLPATTCKQKAEKETYRSHAIGNMTCKLQKWVCGNSSIKK